MTALAILKFCCFVAALTGLLVQLLLENQRASRQRKVVLNPSTRIHDATDLALRRMLQEAQRSIGGHEIQGPPR
jgi:hypothetical protein